MNVDNRRTIFFTSDKIGELYVIICKYIRYNYIIPSVNDYLKHLHDRARDSYLAWKQNGNSWR